MPPSPHVLATLLINDLVEIPDRFVLVLDDYHTITARPVHDFLTFLIDHQPSQMCLVIASRADPPLPLARLRARGQLAELRQGDLFFTPAEASEFINRVMGLELTSEQLATLERRTEGWIAGLQLAALSMRNVQDISSFIEAFSGGHEHIADYLTDEVLARQPETLKSFLLQTSILERLSAPLCEAVAGQVQAQETLEKLKEANLFLVPLDHQQEWYRYHVLFADLLRKRLYQTQGEMVGELHRRASQWYQESGLLAPAVEHALSGQDYERAAGLIEQVGETVLIRSEAVTLLRWLGALPNDQKQTRPILYVFYGLALILTGRPPDGAKSFLQEIAVSRNAEEVPGEIATLRALFAIMQGNTADAIQHSEQALQQLPPGRAFFRSLAADSLGMAYTLRGDTAAAIQAFERVVDIAEHTGNVMMALMALSNMAGVHFLQGKLRASAASYQRVLKLAAERLGERSPTTSLVEILRRSASQNDKVRL